MTIPIEAGIDRALNEQFGIIHIDAHFDLCDTLNGAPLSHGTVERRALELKAPELDPSLTSMFAARKIITEFWGHFARKIGKLEE